MSAPIDDSDLESAAGRWRDSMLEKLRKNAHKPGWMDDGPEDLLDRVDEEFKELERAVRRHSRGECTADEVRSEAADVANMAMMVADVCQLLELKATQ